MRVVHFRKRFSVLSETFVYDYITGLERHGVDNHVVTLQSQNTDCRPFSKVHVLRRPGRLHPSRVATYVMARLRPPAADGSSWPVLRRRLRHLTERLSPDVIHAHFGPEGVLVSPVALQLRIPLVVTFYGSDISRLPRDGPWRTRRANSARRYGDCDVVRHVHDAVRLVARRGGFTSCISAAILARRPPGGGSIPCATHQRRASRREERAPLTLSRVQAYRAGSSDLRLTIIATDRLRSRLEALVRELSLESRVSLLGAHPSRETIERMRHADAFVLCSKTAANGDKEGTPTVLVEAQSIGLPCVATRHAGIPEMIPRDNHRFLAPEADVDGIADCMASLVACTESELRRTSELGRAHVSDHFNLSTEVRTLAAIYHARP